MTTTDTTTEELEREIHHLRALLAEATTAQRLIITKHVEALDKMDNMARIITAVLVQAGGEIPIPSEGLDGLTQPLAFSVVSTPVGYTLSLISRI